jgi:GNAT superfamily N-acetyltransferase
MREVLQYWLEETRLTWQHLCWLVRRIRGVTRDRSGKWYWYLEHQSRPGNFVIRLIRFPSLTNHAYHRNNAGWTSVGVLSEDDPSVWMIFDVQVATHYREQGLGTLLVRAAIRLARRQGARVLRGMVTLDDAREHPFLPEWYARLGFTVQRIPEPDPPPLFTVGSTIATFWVDLTPDAHHLTSQEGQS